MMKVASLIWPLMMMDPTADPESMEVFAAVSQERDSRESSIPPVGPDELSELIDRYTEPLLRAAFSIGFAESDAEELVQDTFVTFLKARENFQGRSKLSTYLFGILYNKAREMRRAKDKERSEEDIETLFDTHFQKDGHWNESYMKELSEPELLLHTNHIGRFIAICLDNLTTPLRIAFVMKEVDGSATARICEILKLTPNHLGVLLFRARNQLRECLKSKGALHF